MKKQKNEPQQPLYHASISTLTMLLFCPRCFWFSVKYGITPPGHPPKIFSEFSRQISLRHQRLRHNSTDYLAKLFDLKIRLADDREIKKIGHRLSFKDLDRGLGISGEVDDYAISPSRKVVIPIKAKIWDGTVWSRRNAKANEIDALKLGLANFLLLRNGHKIEWRGFLSVWQAAIDPELLAASEYKPKIVKVGVRSRDISRFLNAASSIAHSVREPEPGADCEICRSYFPRRLETGVLSMKDWYLPRHRRPRK